MLRTLHLTNGTAIIGKMRAASVTGPIVPWDDVLHEGPVPAGLNVSAMRQRRAEFLASCGWGKVDAITRELAERDGVLGEFAPGTIPAWDEVVLWFEHDLYDQLQLLQILERLPLDGSPRVTAVPDTEYLGLLPESRFRELFDHRGEVTSTQRLAARDAWDAFRSVDPRQITAVLPRVTALPHMAAALTRHLQQFPSLENGLSRTEQQALETVANGITRLGDVFTQSHLQREESFFMGDSGFLLHLSALMRPPQPLLRHVPRRSTADTAPETSLALDDEVMLSDAGRRVLQDKADRVALCGIDRWLGGVYLCGTGPVWRWDRTRQTVRIA